MEPALLRRLISTLFVVQFLFLASCSGISFLQGADKSNLYTPEFLEIIEGIKFKYNRGDSDEALRDLQTISEQELLPSERALRRNLIGVIYFSQEKFEQAIYNFDLALSTSRLDRPLTAQIYLNLASSYFRLDMVDRSFSALGQADFRSLQPEEAKKYHRLNFQLASELNRIPTQISSLIWYLSDKQNVSTLRDEPYFQELLDRFFRLEQREMLRSLNEFDRDPFFIVGYLAYLTVERLTYQGQKGDADNLIRWIQRRFSEDSDVSQLLTQFLFRAEKFGQINQFQIGIVLPLSGEKQGFGERVLKGIDSSLQKHRGVRDPETGQSKFPYELLIRDSQGNPPVAAHRVRELVEQNNVSIIIGGLFSDEAKLEYLEARRYGVFYISLSEIYLPKDQKDHLLLEIPGSVESQMAHLFSPSMLENFGKRAAVVYPETERGESFVNEFWRRANQSNVQITALTTYQPTQSDFRAQVEGLLGLKYKRERQEELELLGEVYSLEGARSARRVQVLGPQIDFDWIFLAAFPREAIQFVPYFSYYDARDLNIIGGPSWRSQALAQESNRLGILHFVGDNLRQASQEFTQSFTETYEQSPMLIELRAHDAFDITHSILSEKAFLSRDELSFRLRELQKLSGLTGEWVFEDDVWLKQMGTYRLRRGQIQNLERSVPEGSTPATEIEL
jgi:tetratricopeptide (TPR) repeat protein